MSPTSYLAAPPRGVKAHASNVRAVVGIECRAVHGCGLSQGGGDRHRHQLDAAADRRRRRWAGRPRSSGSSRVTRLGRGVDLSGQLSGEAIEAACEAIADYVAICREGGVENIDAIATSAVRDASNGSAFVAELRERFALSARVLDGEEEARLTYLGATCEHSPSEPTLVDRHRRRLDRADRRHRRRDRLPRLAAGGRRPPQRAPHRRRPAERGRARGPRHRRARPDRGARSPTSPAPAPRPASPSPARPPRSPRSRSASSPTTRSKYTGTSLTLAAIQRLLSQLASAPLSERAEIPGMHPDRAPTSSPAS